MALLKHPEPERIRAMWKAHGKNEYCKCKDCVNLLGVARGDHAYLTCALYRLLNPRPLTTEHCWKSSFQACGEYEKKLILE